MAELKKSTCRPEIYGSRIFSCTISKFYLASTYLLNADLFCFAFPSVSLFLSLSMRTAMTQIVA